MAKAPPVVPETELTTEKIWTLIQPKIDEYWKIAKIFFWVLLGILTPVVSLISYVAVSLFQSESFRDHLVYSYIKVDKLLGEQNKAVFHKQLDEYLKTDNPAKIFDDTKEIPLRVKAAGYVNGQFEKSFTDSFKNLVLAYSFSTSFQLSDTKRDHNLRILKPEGSKAKIECFSTYTNQKQKRNINVEVNNYKDDFPPIAPVPESAKRRQGYHGRGTIDLSGKNASYFEAGRQVEPVQVITFKVDESEAFEGTIYVDCTVQVAGPAGQVGVP